MATTNGERIRRYKAKMKRNGFRRLSIWVHPDLDVYLEQHRRTNECKGRCLERLLLGAAKARPGSGKYPAHIREDLPNPLGGEAK